MTIDTGGSAFPQAVATLAPGMTLRDYFAAKAMQAELISGVCLDEFPEHASRAYKMADAMLERRKT